MLPYPFYNLLSYFVIFSFTFYLKKKKNLKFLFILKFQGAQY